MEHGICLRLTAKAQTGERGLLGLHWGQKTLRDLAPVNKVTYVEAKWANMKLKI